MAHETPIKYSNKVADAPDYSSTIHPICKARLIYLCKKIDEIVQRSHPLSGSLDLETLMKSDSIMIAIVDSGSELDPYTGQNVDPNTRKFFQDLELRNGAYEEVSVSVSTKHWMLALHLAAREYFASQGRLNALLQEYNIPKEEKEIIDKIFRPQLAYLELIVGHEKRWEQGKSLSELEPDSKLKDEIIF